METDWEGCSQQGEIKTANVGGEQEALRRARIYLDASIALETENRNEVRKTMEEMRG